MITMVLFFALSSPVFNFYSLSRFFFFDSFQFCLEWTFFFCFLIYLFIYLLLCDQAELKYLTKVWCTVYVLSCRASNFSGSGFSLEVKRGRGCSASTYTVACYLAFYVIVTQQKWHIIAQFLQEQ